MKNIGKNGDSNQRSSTGSHFLLLLHCFFSFVVCLRRSCSTRDRAPEISRSLCRLSYSLSIVPFEIELTFRGHVKNNNNNATEYKIVILLESTPSHWIIGLELTESESRCTISRRTLAWIHVYHRYTCIHVYVFLLVHINATRAHLIIVKEQCTDL